jgi:hypothetical protein
MRLINLDGAQAVQHPEHGTAEAGPDGVFDVETELGEALLADRAHWTTEADHVAAQAQKALEDLADPKKVPHVLLELRTRIADLETELAAVREQLDGGKTADPENGENGETADGGKDPADGEPELTRQQKAAATRAAKKAAEAVAAPDA